MPIWLLQLGSYPSVQRNVSKTEISFHIIHLTNRKAGWRLEEGCTWFRSKNTLHQFCMCEMFQLFLKYFLTGSRLKRQTVYRASGAHCAFYFSTPHYHRHMLGYVFEIVPLILAKIFRWKSQGCQLHSHIFSISLLARRSLTATQTRETAFYLLCCLSGCIHSSYENKFTRECCCSPATC